MNEKLKITPALHPEDVIFEVKTFVNQMSKVQEEKFDQMCKSLRMNDKGEDWLFDYVYNCDEPVGFDEYLSKFGELYENCISTAPDPVTDPAP